MLRQEQEKTDFAACVNDLHLMDHAASSSLEFLEPSISDHSPAAVRIKKIGELGSTSFQILQPLG